ncbi:MAG: hypothetical protein ACRC9L_00360 [Brevinema sp.]
MEDVIKYLIFTVFFLLLNACSTYQKANQLYNKGEFGKSYEILRQNPLNGDKYRILELKVLLGQAFSGNTNYLHLLEEHLLLPAPKKGEDIYRLTSAWLIFLRAQTSDDFKSILSILPTEPIKDPIIEYARLVVQNQSLLKLQRYQEAVFNLDGKTGRRPDLVYLLASAYKGMKKNEESLLLYRETIKISKDTVLQGLSYFYIGEILEQEGKPKEAKDAYLKSWGFAADNATLNFKIGQLLSIEGYETLPQRFYRSTLRLDENHAEAWYYLNL